MSRRISIALLLLLLFGLVLPKVAARAAAAAGRSGVLLDVPFVRQRERNACGAASLSMVMQYWERQTGRRHSPQADQRFIDRKLDPRDHGIANTVMAGYLRSHGFRVFTFSGRWQDLRENLEKGRPLVVGLGPEGEKGPLHYVVVAGMDWKRNFVFVNDPAQRKLFRMTRRRFLTEWRATGNWTLLAVPKEAA